MCNIYQPAPPFFFPSAWVAMYSNKQAFTLAEAFVVGPDGGNPLYISGIGFDLLEKSLGRWNPSLVSCIFTPSEDGADVVKVDTTLVDGVIEGTRMLSCTIPQITSGTTANVTLEWSSGDAVSLYASSSGSNTLYSASWYTGIKLVDGQ